MQDAIIAGTCNSRYLRSISDFLTQYPTYSDFVAALVSGSLPIDLNGINESGFRVVGTPLDKATLLDDQTSEAISAMLTSYSAPPSTPNEAMALLTQVVGENIQLETGSYEGGNKYGPTQKNSIPFTRQPKMVWVWSTRGGYGLLSPFFYSSDSTYVMQTRVIEFSDSGYEYSRPINYSWNNNILSWYADGGNTSYQLDQSGITYSYLAICGAPLKILSQPKSVAAPLGSEVYFKVIAAGTGLRYQWQYRTGSPGSWNNSPATGNTTSRLTVPATSDRNGYQYRCKVTVDTGTTINSSAATLTITS